MDRERITRELKEFGEKQYICLNLDHDIKKSVTPAEIWMTIFPDIYPSEMLQRFSRAWKSQNTQLTIGAYSKGYCNFRSRPIIDTKYGPNVSMDDLLEFNIDKERRMLHIFGAKVSHDKQGNGTSKRLLSELHQLAELHHIRKMAVTAGVPHGGYVWARFGFTPCADGQTGTSTDWKSLKTQVNWHFGADYVYDGNRRYPITQEEHDTILEALQSDDPQSIRMLSDLGRMVNPDERLTVGKCLLFNTGWMGELRLDPNEKGYQQFCHYIGHAAEIANRPGRGSHGKE